MANPSHDDDDRETASAQTPDPADTLSSLPLPPSRRPPKDFGGYRFMELLGRGAFGQVFKVWSASTQRYEAMKILHQEDASGGEQLDAFKHEVHRMANVRSTHVVHVYHADVLPDGRRFFTMEYLGGGRLDRYCDRTRVPLEERIRAVADICDAVQGMHELNLVHCDIKPANIVVQDDSGAMIPKLVDFGLASQRAFRPSPSSMPRGTLPYMPPEQLESHGGDPERRWDIYALGATLYQLIVGECPIERFPDPSLPVDVLADHVRRTPIPSLLEKLTSTDAPRSDEIAAARRMSVARLRRRLRDPWLEAIVGKALAKERVQRYASAAEMAHNLRRYLAGRRPAVVPPSIRDRVREFAQRRRVALVVVALLTAVSAAVVYRNAQRRAVRNARVLTLFHEGSSAVDPRLAIDRYEAALALDPTRSDIRLHLAGARAVNGDVEGALETARSIAQGGLFFGKAQSLIGGLLQLREGGRSDHDPAADPPDVSPGDAYYYALSLDREHAPLAIALLGKAINAPGLEYDDRFRIRLMRAMRYFQVCDFDALNTEAVWLVETAPRSAVAWNLRGLADWNGGRTARALDAYNKAIEINSEYAAAFANRAAVRNELKLYDQALADCDEAVSIRPSIASWVDNTRVLALLGGGETGRTKDLCTRVLSDAEATGHTHGACGFLWNQVRAWTRAWNESDKAIRARESGGSCETQGTNDVWFRGVAAFHLKRYAQAISDFDSFERADPDRWSKDWTRPLFRATTLLANGSLERVVSDLQHVVRMRRGTPSAALFQLWIWDALLDLKDPVRAAAALEIAGELARSDERLSNIVKHCMGVVGRDVVLTGAGKDSAKITEAYYYLGLAAKARGDHARAVDCFRSCRQHNVVDHLEYDLAETQLARLSQDQ